MVLAGSQQLSYNSSSATGVTLRTGGRSATSSTAHLRSQPSPSNGHNNHDSDSDSSDSGDGNGEFMLFNFFPLSNVSTELISQAASGDCEIVSLYVINGSVESALNSDIFSFCSLVVCCNLPRTREGEEKRKESRWRNGE